MDSNVVNSNAFQCARAAHALNVAFQSAIQQSVVNAATAIVNAAIAIVQTRIALAAIFQTVDVIAIVIVVVVSVRLVVARRDSNLEIMRTETVVLSFFKEKSFFSSFIYLMIYFNLYFEKDLYYLRRLFSPTSSLFSIFKLVFFN